MKSNTKKLATIGVLCGMAYVVTLLIRIPVVLFLKYDPKDVIITIGGLLYGPLASVLISVIVSLIEMFTISDTGIWGFVMNVIQSCSFACTAAIIYKKKRNLTGAIVGLICGWLLTVGVMMLWNYLITPIYMGYPRAAVVKLLLPAFLPFNLLKGGLNAAITALLYKPVSTALRRAHIIDAPEQIPSSEKKPHLYIGLIIGASAIIVTCVLFILALNGII